MPHSVDWGFTNFAPLADVRAEYVHPDGSVVVRCELSTDPSVVPPEPPQNLMLGAQHYDCRRETGHGKKVFLLLLLFGVDRERERARKREEKKTTLTTNNNNKKLSPSFPLPSQTFTQSASRTRAPPAT